MRVGVGFGVAAVGGLAFLLLYYGAPGKDNDGRPIQDQFSHSPSPPPSLCARAGRGRSSEVLPAAYFARALEQLQAAKDVRRGLPGRQ